MIETKPKSIDTVGIIIIVVSIFIIISNVCGALVSDIFKDEFNDEKDSIFILDHYLEICLIMITTGIILLIGGIFFRKYKLWASRLIMALTFVFVIMLWSFFLLMVDTLNRESAPIFLSVFCILLAVVFTIPLGMFIRYLNLKRIKQYFN